MSSATQSYQLLGLWQCRTPTATATSGLVQVEGCGTSFSRLHNARDSLGLKAGGCFVMASAGCLSLFVVVISNSQHGVVSDKVGEILEPPGH